MARKNTARKDKSPSVRRKLLGIIMIVAGLGLFSVPSLSPASIFVENKDITVSAGEQVTLRYGYLNDGSAPHTFDAAIYQDNTVTTTTRFTLAPKTIYSGIMSFKAPLEKGTFTYTLKVGNEQQQFRVVVK